MSGIRTPDLTPFGANVASIAQSWLMREASDATLEQSRHSLKFGLAGFSRLASISGHESGGSVAELARSLHTDRPNLTRAIKAAESDPELKALLDSIA